MKKPTIKEVREHFKNANIVLCVLDNKTIMEVEDINFVNGEFPFYYTGVYGSDDNTYAGLWSKEYGYAEIMHYKTEEKTLKNPASKHYLLWDDFEAIDVIKLSLTSEEYKGFLKGNILKYKLREKGQDESDNIKVQDYKRELNNL